MQFAEKHFVDHRKDAEDAMIPLSPDSLKRLTYAGNTQVVGEDIPPIKSVFDLKSGVQAKLIDRSGSMVIVEVQEYRSDWIEWSEVKARIAAK
jgi:hypothetical protein